MPQGNKTNPEAFTEASGNILIMYGSGNWDNLVNLAIKLRRKTGKYVHIDLNRCGFFYIGRS